MKKIQHIISEYRKLKILCGAYGGKVMSFRKYFFMKWRELKEINLK